MTGAPPSLEILPDVTFSMNASAFVAGSRTLRMTLPACTDTETFETSILMSRAMSDATAFSFFAS
jgi:hypothetical protein